ncbi:zinc finger protein 385A isoform X3 [Electrophorus electricus]|uniref:zinc finger protein 385A isoform X3 n=1 Tax=Electrophorus electricus TaxID=8005 RepID=UPI0015D0A8A7|nr:zinc finger protein 385A isoform X3 [Electrophorus electricus]
MILGSINRTGAVPTFLRTPTVIQPHLDMKPFLQFPMETAPPHSVGLFHNFNTMDPVQKAVINHTFGVPLVKTKRPVISCNVCQIRFNSESQAEAHYKGNRHARRVKGIETSKSRPLESDKPPPGPMASLSPPGTLLPSGDTDSSRADETQLNRSLAAQGPMSAPATPDSPGPLMPSPASTLALPAATSIPGCGSSNPEQAGPGATAAVMGPAHGNPETEEDKAKKLLYCSLCKVAVNSLSQLEAHNKGTKHKTILEARSGLGPIKAYPRLCPKPSGEQGGGPTDPNTQERTFHCEICNVRVNSELQLKQHISSRRHRDGVAGKPNPLLSRHKKQRGADLADLTKALGAGLLPSPLAVAAAMAAAASSGPLALRAAAPAPHPHHHLLQGPPLSHAILRPAPGPIRTSHGPILFSPY